MPVPIMPVNTAPLERGVNSGPAFPSVDYGTLDVSMLNGLIKQPVKTAITKVSDFDAALLFKLWREGKELRAKGDGVYKVPENLTNSEVLRLKANGLLTGDEEVVELTNRAKEVIQYMALAEENTFEKQASEKPLHEAVKEATTPRRKTILALGEIKK